MTQLAESTGSAHHRTEPTTWRDVWKPAHRAPLVLLALALLAWLVALPTVGGQAVSEWGLLASASPLLVVSIVLTVFGFIAAVRARSAGLVLGSAVVLGAVLRLTIAIGTDSAFYPWTYKHIAVSEYIASTGSVDPSADVYNNWPGLFAATAWMSKLTGVTAFGIAHWFTPVLHIGLILGMYVFARQWGASTLVAAVSAFLYEAFDFLGQDYFSPQAVSIFLGFGVLALLGSTLRHRDGPGNGFAAIAGFAFTAIVVTHQLTPFWLLVVIVVLAVFRRIKVYWLPVYAVVAAGGYLLAHYSSVKYFGVVSSDVTSNVRATATGSPLTDVRLSWYASDILYGLGFVIAFVLAVRAFRRRDRFWSMWMMAFFPVGLLLVQGYGGEAIFRVFLFALPALAFLIAGSLVPMLLRSRVGVWAAGVVAAVLILDSAQTTFVTWPSYRVTAEEASLIQHVQDTAPLNSFIAPLSDGAVNQLTATYVERYNYDKNYGSSIQGSHVLPSDFATSTEYREFAAKLVSSRKAGRPLYIVLSSRLGAYGWQYGLMKRDAVANLRAAMSADPRWQIAGQNDDAVGFRLVSP